MISVTVTATARTSVKPPESVTVTGMSPIYAHDAAVSLTCAVADANPAADSFVWSRNGAVVSGATSQTFNLPADCLDDGDVYSCTAGNTLGSVASADVVLNVAGGFQGSFCWSLSHLMTESIARSTGIRERVSCSGYGVI